MVRFDSSPIDVKAVASPCLALGSRCDARRPTLRKSARSATYSATVAGKGALLRLGDDRQRSAMRVDRAIGSPRHLTRSSQALGVLRPTRVRTSVVLHDNWGQTKALSSRGASKETPSGGALRAAVLVFFFFGSFFFFFLFPWGGFFFFSFFFGGGYIESVVKGGWIM